MHVVLQLEHERVWDMWRYTHLQLQVVTQQWQRDYKELVNRALITLEEAKHAHQEELKLQKDRKHQRDVCLQLRKKVCAWNCHILNPNVPFLMLQFPATNHIQSQQGRNLSFRYDSFCRLSRISSLLLSILSFYKSHMLLDWMGFCWPAAFYFVVFHHVPCEVVRNVWQISSAW